MLSWGWVGLTYRSNRPLKYRWRFVGIEWGVEVVLDMASPPVLHTEVQVLLPAPVELKPPKFGQVFDFDLPIGFYPNRGVFLNIKNKDTAV